MPTLLRLLLVLGVLAAIVYGTMSAMVAYLKPQPREMTQTIMLPSAPKEAPAAPGAGAAAPK